MGLVMSGGLLDAVSLFNNLIRSRDDVYFTKPILIDFNANS
jgi:hypothetical protein